MIKGIDSIGIAVIFLCHDGEGNVILSKRGKNCRDEQGTWDPGGGAVELHDTVLQTLQNEIKQEYGTTVLDFEFLGFRDVHREVNGKTHWIGLDYKVLVDRTLVSNCEPQKFDDVGWFRLTDLPFPLHSQFPCFLSKHHSKLKEFFEDENTKALKHHMQFPDEDYPGQRREIAIADGIRRATEAADRIIMDVSDGSNEETNYLTYHVAMKILDHISCRISGDLLSYSLKQRTKS